MAVLRKTIQQFSLLAARLQHKKYSVFLLGSIAFSWVLIAIGITTTLTTVPKEHVLGVGITAAKNVIETTTIEVTLPPAQSPTAIPPSKTPTPTSSANPKKEAEPSPTPTFQPPQPTSNPSQYTAEKIDDTTWRVKNITNDLTMASAQDIINALNSYRGSRGKSNLTVDLTLSTFAQERANLFSNNNSLDSHAGFREYMDNDGFEKSGFNSLGENSAMLSGPMNGEKIIRNIFGADPEHDGNQLDNWTHVGVGISGNAINVNFGKNKR